MNAGVLAETPAGEEIVTIPDGSTILEAGDEIYVLGEPDKLIGFKQLFC
jgi:Trk K+ transport system NAD-binding subunit